ncbi:hypothetical protein FQA39_LY09823 [Lamprigera yunnana]|nr:hypothetical protein FQA39_LY09823 [Lamprigera yunnana]
MDVWTVEEVDELICLINSNSILYDMSLPGYSNRDVKDDLWRKVASRISNKNAGVLPGTYYLQSDGGMIPSPVNSENSDPQIENCSVHLSEETEELDVTLVEKEAPEPAKEYAKKKSRDSMDQAFEQYLTLKTKKMLNTEPKTNSSTKLFLLSLLPDVDQLSDDNKLKFKIKTLELLQQLQNQFPLEKRLMEKWLINCGNINLIDLTPVQLYEKRVCASHFSCKHFTNSLKNRLIQGAVPLHYNTKENADKQLNISTETLNLKREAVPKVYKQSRVAEDLIPSAASPLSEINDDSASELNKSPTLLQVVGVCDIFSFGLVLYLTQTLYRVSRNEGAKRKSQLVDIILCRFNPNYLSPKMLLKRAEAPYR